MTRRVVLSRLALLAGVGIVIAAASIFVVRLTFEESVTIQIEDHADLSLLEGQASKELRQLADEFLGIRARSGTILDYSDIAATEIEDPLVPGSTIRLIWEQDLRPKEMERAWHGDLGFTGDRLSVSVEASAVSEIDSCMLATFASHYQSVDKHQLWSCTRMERVSGYLTIVREGLWRPAVSQDGTLPISVEFNVASNFENSPAISGPLWFVPEDLAGMRNSEDPDDCEYREPWLLERALPDTGQYTEAVVPDSSCLPLGSYSGKPGGTAQVGVSVADFSGTPKGWLAVGGRFNDEEPEGSDVNWQDSISVDVQVCRPFLSMVCA